MNTSVIDGEASLRDELKESALGLGFVATYLTIFTVGSQVPSPVLRTPATLSDAILTVLTYRETSICLLSIVAACLGTWRRIYQASVGAVISTNLPRFLAYTSACIGGLITTAIVVGLPNVLDQMSDQINISRDLHHGAGPRNYISLAMIASLAAFFSGYDKTFLDKLLAVVSRKLGFATNLEPASPTIATEAGSNPPVRFPAGQAS
jgi:hypothetical protein